MVVLEKQEITQYKWFLNRDGLRAQESLIKNDNRALWTFSFFSLKPDRDAAV